MLFHWSIWSNT